MTHSKLLSLFILFGFFALLTPSIGFASTSSIDIFTPEIIRGQLTIGVNSPSIEITRNSSNNYISIKAGNCSMIMEEGNPEIPQLTTTIAIPSKGKITAKLVNVKYSEQTIENQIVPSRGHLTRNIPLNTVPLTPSAVYSTDSYFPADDFTVSVGTPFIVRDLRGVRLSLPAILYNGATNHIKILESAQIQITVTDEKGRNEKHLRITTLSSSFDSVYQVFENYDLFKSRNSITVNRERNERAIIISPDKFTNVMKPLLDWRETKGLKSKLVAVSDILKSTGDEHLTGELLKQYIKSEYDTGNLTYVLLVGDYDTMPTLRGGYEDAHSDATLAMCEGNDFIPDVFISRFSAKSDNQLETQVVRAISYEKNPVTGEAGSFYKTAVGVASDEGTIKDWERADMLRDALLDYNFTEVARVYDPDASEEKLVEAIEAGCSLINYIGHGTEHAWATTWLDSFGVSMLKNTDGKWPMIWSVACLNGHFAYGGDCFCESFAKAGTPENPCGAIGIVGSTTNMAWVPPCVWQKAIIDDCVTSGKGMTGAAMHLTGLIKCCEEYGFDEGDRGVQLIEQCIFFGDSSVVIRDDIPEKATITVNPSSSLTGKTFSIKVLVKERPVENAFVSISSADSQKYSGLTNSKGIVTISIPEQTPANNLKITVTGKNIVLYSNNLK